MKSAIMAVAIGCIASLLGACGGHVGDSGEFGVAESAIHAFANGDVEDIFNMYAPEYRASKLLGFDRKVRQMQDDSKEGREASLKQINDEMWWDTDWDKVEELDDLAQASDAEKANYLLRDLREYSSKERTKGNFQDAIKDLRVVDYGRNFLGANLDWGAAMVRYENAVGDSIQVEMAQRAGKWFVTDFRVDASDKGLAKRDKQETLDRRK